MNVLMQQVYAAFREFYSRVPLKGNEAATYVAVGNAIETLIAQAMQTAPVASAQIPQEQAQHDGTIYGPDQG